MTAYYTLEWLNEGALRVLDQRLLPNQVAYLTLTDTAQVAEAIRNMTVRGAPAIGAAAAFGLALAAVHNPTTDLDEARKALHTAGKLLCDARPTAVNLFWAVNRMLDALDAGWIARVDELREAALMEAFRISAEDVETNRKIGENALSLLPNDEVTFIHHCNTGTLATVEYGTALGIIRTAHEAGRKVFVFVDETRPRLQGAKLTAWELTQLGIPYRLIVDGAAAYTMKTHHVDAVTVGCDRVAANGDTANKIGTYGLAIAARAHGVPFYIAAPTSTIDLCTPTGADIEIEERAAEEITNVGVERIAPEGCQVFNPAFDVTPAEYITAIITEMGVAYPPFTESLRALVNAARSSKRR